MTPLIRSFFASPLFHQALNLEECKHSVNSLTEGPSGERLANFLKQNIASTANFKAHNAELILVV